MSLAAGLQGLDMTPAGIMPEHFDVNQPDHELFEESLVEPGIFETRFEGFDLLRHDHILLRLAFALADCPDE